MNEQAFGVLEYDALCALVRRGAQTVAGRARADTLAPLSSLAEVRRALAAVSESLELQRRGARWSFSELADPSEQIARLKIEGAVLDPLALLELARLCDQAGEARALIQSEREVAPVLWELVADLPRELYSLAARVTSKILPGGELDDRASPELARIRHDINRLRSAITRSLESLMRRSEEAIQDELVTIRNDRFVVPVRADHRGRVAGVAHGSSSSGMTVFVEPLETIEANNELQALRETELREITRILATLTDEMRRELPSIERAADAVAELDFIAAKAALASALNCVEPTISEGGALELDEARHPLLEETLRAEGGKVVPISLKLDSDRPVMIISGANAGGKTVVLKTAGLVALMALSGLHVPARSVSVPLYASVLADIGDRQSLAAHLSTFTAHVRNITQMIESCERPALVLLDEVGTGTDPEEGSALGVAVVDHFRRACGAHVVATTHYSGLKHYAASDAGVTNASVEFDEKTLQPTYRLLVGVAGSSSGLEIARRFGFPAAIIREAASHVGEAARAAGEYLRRIKREAEEAETLRRALEEERAAVAEKYNALEREAAQRENERQQNFERDLRARVAEFEQHSRELVAKIEDRAERVRVEREAERRAAELRREAKQAAQAARAATKAATVEHAGGVRVVRRGDASESSSFSSAAASASATSHTSGSASPAQPASSRASSSAATELRPAAEQREIVKGDAVRLRAFGKTGVVESVRDGEAEVRVGNLRLREKLQNLELMERVASKTEDPQRARTAQLEHMAAARPTTEVRLGNSHRGAQAELNLIGRTTDEASDALDKFLDDAYVNQLSHVRVIHGHGTGALRRAVAELLKGHPHVAHFELAPPDQGGAGATVVELKQ